MISIIIPVYNEFDSLPELMTQLRQTLDLYDKWEIIFIDDGSTDGTTEYLEELSTKEKEIKFIQFHRNYGKSAALSEGFKLAQGEYLVTMDADLQDDPAEIPNLMKKLEEGYDLISGWKKDRKDPLSKRAPSKLFNIVTRILTGVKIHDFNCGLKIYRKAVVKTLDIYGGRHRYIPALAGQKRFRIGEIVVNHRPRVHGETKYGGARLFHGFFDLLAILFLTRYTQQPLHLFGLFGLFSLFTGTACEVYVLYLKYFQHHPFQKHFALMLLGAMIIVLGLWFFSIGLIAEMVAQVTQDREFRVKRIIQ